MGDFLDYEKKRGRRWNYDRVFNAGCVTVIVVCALGLFLYVLAVGFGVVKVAPIQR